MEFKALLYESKKWSVFEKGGTETLDGEEADQKIIADYGIKVLQRLLMTLGMIIGRGKIAECR